MIPGRIAAQALIGASLRRPPVRGSRTGQISSCFRSLSPPATLAKEAVCLILCPSTMRCPPFARRWARARAPCWSPRPARARRRAYRWRSSMNRGRRGENCSCSSRAASPRAPPRRGWPQRWAKRSARRSACGCACRASLGPHADRGRHRGRVHADAPRGSRARGRCGGAVRRVPRTLARRGSRLGAGARAQGALREDLRLLVMSATLDGARVRALVGDAPLIESQGRARPIATR